ncbi:MAG: enolase C-terminal domain-like protein, partial [Oricola sp.]
MRDPLPAKGELTLRGIDTRAVMVPLNFALGTSAAIVRAVPLILVDVHTREGVVGRSYGFCYTKSGARAVAGHLSDIIEIVKDHPASPRSIAALLGRRLALLGVTGTVRMALSLLDMALWDAAAVKADLPLFAMLGANRRSIPAYDSRGLGLMPADRLPDEAEALLASGLGAIKLRLGYETLAQDLEALAAVRRRVPSGVGIMVDYNQALTTTD